MSLEQAVFYRYSRLLSLQQILSTNTAAPAETKGPSSPGTCLQEGSTDVLHKSTCTGQAHSGIYAEYSFKTILGEFQWQKPCLLLKKLWEGFSPTFS